ncbi:MAG: ChaN family lipoprotein [Bacteroidetes bacterium]|nr:ChaN family lipoprotein [Bacteroidota bacterium]
MRLLIFALIIPLISLAQKDKPAYQLFDIKGKATRYTKLLAAAKDADMIFFGEMHNNPISHWLQYELTVDLAAINKQNLVLGAEMFETEDQVALNEYLAGLITDEILKKEIKLWPNYKTDYAPLLELAKDSAIPFIATSIPRRYASMVYKNGLESLEQLDAQAKEWIAPLPIKYDVELPGYMKMLEMAGPHGGDKLPNAQAIKDATMAHFILKNMKENSQFIHYNGAYHSNNFEGIVWYIKQKKPELKILTISTGEQETINKLDEESIGVADFVLLVPMSMTKTH